MNFNKKHLRRILDVVVVVIDFLLSICTKQHFFYLVCQSILVQLPIASSRVAPTVCSSPFMPSRRHRERKAEQS